MKLQELNRMIGRTLRAIQLATDNAVRQYLNMAIGWLNMARRFIKQGRDPQFALGMAYARIRAARQIATI